jgi:hypothetical protein
MEGKRCSSAAEGWRVGVRTEEVREREWGRGIKRETLMGLAQTNIAQ